MTNTLAPPRQEWSRLADSCRNEQGRLDRREFSSEFLRIAAEHYHRSAPSAELVEFSHGPAVYLFDIGSCQQAERTVAVVAHPEPPHADRDASYQRGYPLPERLAGRPIDRGHVVPYTAGGLFGPNMFVQDRALNRGWSAEGRAYRALERAAVASSSALMIAWLLYADDTATPEFVDLGVIDGPEFSVQRFRNRYDTIDKDSPDALETYLAGATDAQIGALGEETTAVLLEDTFDATIVAMGDAALPRQDGRQELDLLAIVDGELIAFEVKTRFLSQGAGRITRAGNLPRPRLRRAAQPSGDRQGSQGYVAARVAHHVDTGNDFDGIDVRVIAVDLRAMLAQQFSVNDAGSRLTPINLPVACADAAGRALAQILDHRGYL